MLENICLNKSNSYFLLFIFLLIGFSFQNELTKQKNKPNLKQSNNLFDYNR